MKKVCVLSTVDMSRMTLLSLYTEYLHKNGIQYDIICAKKKQENKDPYAENIYEFDAAKSQNSSVLGKIMHFWSMRSFANEIFDKNDYSFIIVWNEVTSFIFSDILKKRFKGRFCINIRDYQYNNLPIICQRMNSSLKTAAFNTISSDGFKKFLPKGEYLMIHSFNEAMLSSLDKPEKLRTKEEPIRILNIGQIRWCEHCYPLIDALANDDRYELYFIGTGSEAIDRYIENKHIHNVFTHGRFSPEETVQYLKNADVIFNLYGVGNLHVDTALSIKLYYAAYLAVPILTYRGTYMDTLSTQLGIGFTVEHGNLTHFADEFYDWYHQLDKQNLRDRCDAFLQEAQQSHQQLYTLLDSFINDIKK